jgi:hypothetical protein
MKDFNDFCQTFGALQQLQRSGSMGPENPGIPFL